MHGQVLWTYILILSLEWAAVGLMVFGLICLVRYMWEWWRQK